MGPSKTPTKDEREWMAMAREFGCIACWIDGNQRLAAIHHIVKAGRRLGHKFSLPLCDPGHHQNGAQFGMISVHPWRKQFEARYGTELELLETLKAKLARREAA